MDLPSVVNMCIYLYLICRSWGTYMCSLVCVYSWGAVGKTLHSFENILLLSQSHIKSLKLMFIWCRKVTNIFLLKFWSIAQLIMCIRPNPVAKTSSSPERAGVAQPKFQFITYLLSVTSASDLTWFIFIDCGCQGFLLQHLFVLYACEKDSVWLKDVGIHKVPSVHRRRKHKTLLTTYENTFFFWEFYNSLLLSPCLENIVWGIAIHGVV